MRRLRVVCSTILAAVIFLGLSGCRQPDVVSDQDAAPAPPPQAQPSVAQRLTAIATAEHLRIDPQDTIPAALRDEDAAVRARAALALGRMAAVSAAPQLALRLADADAEVRRYAVFALRLILLDAPPHQGQDDLQSGLREALLRQLAQETDGSVRAQLIITLGWVGTADDRTALRALTTPEDRPAVTIAVGLLGLRRVLDPAAVTALAPTVAQAEAGPERDAVLWAIDALGGLAPGTERALVATLQRVISDDTPHEGARFAARALARLGQRDVNVWLWRQWQAADLPLQTAILPALGDGGPTGLARLLVGLRQAWQALAAQPGSFSTAQIYPVLAGLQALRRHSDRPVVRRLAQALWLEMAGRQNQATLNATEAHGLELLTCAAATLVDKGRGRPTETAHCGTVRAAQLDAPLRRRRVAELIGELPRDSVSRLHLLRRYVADEDATVRTAATQSLATMAAGVALAPLKRALADPALSVVTMAAEVVTAWAKQGQPLEPVLAVAVAKRLAALPTAAAPEAACALIRALGHLATPDALALLRQAATTPPAAVRVCAFAALAQALGERQPLLAPTTAHALPPSALRSVSDARPQVRIDTGKGAIVLELFSDEAPLSVAHFIAQVTAGAYDTLRVTNVVPFQTVHLQRAPDISDRGAARVPCELTPRPYLRGSVGIWVAGRDTNRGDLLISLIRQPDLDGRFTQMGQVIAGIEVVEQLFAQEPVRIGSRDLIPDG